MRSFLLVCACSSVSAGVRKVSAGILPVGVEEQIEEIVAEIIVMRDVPSRPADRIIQRPARASAGDAVHEAEESLRAGGGFVAHEQGQQAIEIGSGIGDDRAVHEPFAQGHRGRCEELPVPLGIGQAHRHRVVGTAAFRFAEHVPFAVRVGDNQGSRPVIRSWKNGMKGFMTGAQSSLCRGKRRESRAATSQQRGVPLCVPEAGFCESNLCENGSRC